MIIIPSFVFIEAAVDHLEDHQASDIKSEIKEFLMLSDATRNKVLESVRSLTRSNDDDPMLCGYLLGLETARVILRTNLNAVGIRL